MKMKKNLFLLLGITILASVSCKKEDPQPEPEEEEQETTSQMSSYFTNNADAAKQTFTFDASTTQSITGDKGTQITIYANSFVYSDGSPVSGNVDLELIEVLDVSEMVRLNKPTVSNDELLVSGGQIKVTVTQNSTELDLVPGYGLSVNIPTSDPDPQMGLFTGTESANGDVSWTSASIDTSQTDSVTTWQDSTGTSYFNFQFDNDNLGWINCDYWWDSGQPKTTVTADLSGNTNTHDYTNTYCYLVFPQINSVTSMYNTTNSSEFSVNSIPINQQATFCCISEINGDYYSAFVSSTLVNNHVEVITMTQTTLVDIETAISNL